MAFCVEPCAKRIVDLNDNHKITSNEDILREILLDPDVKDKEVCVVSITGTFRQGKSFLLNFLLRYLNLKYKTKKSMTKKWLDAADGNILGFPFKCGIERHTTGILMWSEIFIADLPSGKELAIVLLDTQGTFDNATAKQHGAAIFAISALISSVQIFNLKEKINQFDLEHLECFSGYGQLALEENSESRGPPFQNLCFLIRDWPFKFEFGYGTSGGQKFFEKVVHASDLPLQTRKQNDNIIKLFQSITCCTLPHPGEAVASDPSFKGEFTDINPTFIQCIEEFIPTILAPENLIAKAVNGQKIKVSDLLTFIPTYCQHFSSGKVPPLPTMYTAVSEAQLTIASNESEEMYRANMDAIVHTKEALKNAVLEEHHLEEKQNAMEHFCNKKIMGNAELKKKFTKSLQENIDADFLEYERLNQIKQEKELIQQKALIEEGQQEQNLHYEEIQTQCQSDHFMKLEMQLLEEKHKHDEEKFQLEIENMKLAQAHQEELQAKEREVQNEKQKRSEDELAHQQAMLAEQLRSKTVEMEAEQQTKIFETEMRQKDIQNDWLKTENENLKQHNEICIKTLKTANEAADAARREAQVARRDRPSNSTTVNIQVNIVPGDYLSYILGSTLGKK